MVSGQRAEIKGMRDRCGETAAWLGNVSGPSAARCATSFGSELSTRCVRSATKHTETVADLPDLPGRASQPWSRRPDEASHAARVETPDFTHERRLSKSPANGGGERVRAVITLLNTFLFSLAPALPCRASRFGEAFPSPRRAVKK